MDHEPQPWEIFRPGPSKLPSKIRHLSKDEWETLRDEVHEIYIEEKHTLLETMEVVQQRHGFEASLRKWKMQVKEWKFEKHLKAGNMITVLTKAEKRARDEGKESIFFHADSELSTQKIMTFKKRKTAQQLESTLPTIELPPTITCHTPLSIAISISSDADYIRSTTESPARLTCMSDVGSLSNIMKPQNSDDMSTMDAPEDYGRIDYRRAQFLIQEEISNDESLPRFVFDLVQEPTGRDSPYRNEKPTQASALDMCIPSRIRRSNDYFAVVRKPGVWIEFPLSVELFLPCNIDDVSLDDADRSINKLTERLERLEAHLVCNIREDFGALLSWKGLRCVSELAYIYQKQNRLTTAADLYNKLLDGYESLEAFEHHLSAQYLLARIQQRRGLHEEATEELIHAFSTCIRLKFDRGRQIKLSGRMSDIIAGLIVSNQRLRLANWDEVHFTLEKISGLLEAFVLQEVSDPDLNNDLPPTIIFLAARLANEFTMVKDFESTTVLFSTIIQYLEHFNDIEYGTEKVCAYLKFALHLQRQGRWTQANSLLRLADERAMNADPHDIDLSYCLRWCYAQLGSKQVHESDPTIKETKILLARIQETAFSSVIKFSRGPYASPDHFRGKESDDEEDFDMISEDQSYKYGVTFSRSVVTGFSDSIS